ncbi:MAG TPA: hypothetical protein VFQ06_03025, partial [Nitrospira sp.]|nr:hypothetical protein [Nitrospira sp.]
KTFWKKYDADTLTSYDIGDANRASRFRYAATLGLTKPEIFQPRYTNKVEYSNVVVKSTSEYEKGLGPRIDDVRWTAVGSKNALVSVMGANFFSGTQVTLGDKIFSGNGDGLVLKSNNSFDLTTTIDALASGPGAVSGRYGPAIPFVIDDAAPAASVKNPPAQGTVRAEAPTPPRDKGKGISIARVELGPSLSGMHRLKVFLASRADGNLDLEDLPKNRQGERETPLVTVNGATMALPYLFFNYSEGSRNQVQIQGSVPASALAKGHAVVHVLWPFRGDHWRDVMTSTNPDSAYEIVRAGEKSLILLTTNIGGFSTSPRDPNMRWTDGQCWSLFTGGTPFQLKSSSCPKGDAQSTAVGESAIALNLTNSVPEKVVLMDPEGETYQVPVPKAPSAEAATAAAKGLKAKQYDSVWIEIAVDDVSSVDVVEADGQRLRTMASPGTDGNPAKSIKALLTRAVTDKPGTVDITLFDKTGKPITTATLTIAPCETCKPETK